MSIYWRCCEVESVYGRSLGEGVVLIGRASVVISIVTLLISTICLSTIYARDEQININMHMLMAMNFIFSLVASCFSAYSILISLLLLWKSRQFLPQSVKGDTFVCALWYVSHVSMLIMYLLLFLAKVIVCIIRSYYFTALFTVSIGILYQGILAYFVIVVNSYLHSLDEDRYF